MQRAVASASPGSSTPTSNVSTPSSERPSKRKRLSTDSYPNTPPIVPVSPNPAYLAKVDAALAKSSRARQDLDDAMTAAVNAAVAEEKRKEEAAIQKAAVDAGEDRWVLLPRELDPVQYKPTVKYTTWNDLEDSGSESESDDPESEKAQFGFKRRPVMGRGRKVYGDKSMQVTAPGFLMPDPPDKKRKREESP